MEFLQLRSLKNHAKFAWKENNHDCHLRQKLLQEQNMPWELYILIEAAEKRKRQRDKARGRRLEKRKAWSLKIAGLTQLFTESESEVRKSSNGGKCGEFCILLRVSAGTAFCLAIEMAGRGRDDVAIAEALGMLAGVLGGNPNVVGMGAARQLSEFQKNNPPMFKGAYDPDGAQKWLKEIERIFRVTECADN
ncbi:hypothetical protein KIW84_034454 [Lathyrus oleraceus]|uniref:Uncharacterized protein n=1 Tax=Pisum sativum TaxID=3888 RepID=A0A9D5B4E2_PEA|nr:hypothetical protein KIW84_034454 [Pisum sativum]